MRPTALIGGHTQLEQLRAYQVILWTQGRRAGLAIGRDILGSPDGPRRHLWRGVTLSLRTMVGSVTMFGRPCDWSGLLWFRRRWSPGPLRYVRGVGIERFETGEPMGVTGSSLTVS